MHRAVLVVLSVLVLLVAATGWMSTAQVIDPTTCEQTCYAQQTTCVTACGSHADPIECEARCQDQVEDCLAQCGG
jgi:hypothetical protein